MRNFLSVKELLLFIYKRIVPRLVLTLHEAGFMSWQCNQELDLDDPKGLFQHK